MSWREPLLSSSFTDDLQMESITWRGRFGFGRRSQENCLFVPSTVVAFLFQAEMTGKKIINLLNSFSRFIRCL